MYAAMVANLIATLIDKKPYYERMKERMLKAIGVGVTKKDEEDKMAGFGLG